MIKFPVMIIYKIFLEFMNKFLYLPPPILSPPLIFGFQFDQSQSSEKIIIYVIIYKRSKFYIFLYKLT